MPSWLDDIYSAAGWLKSTGIGDPFEEIFKALDQIANAPLMTPGLRDPKGRLLPNSIEQILEATFPPALANAALQQFLKQYPDLFAGSPTTAAAQTPATPAAGSVAGGTSHNVPFPFDPQYFGDMTATFQEFPGEYGNDYGMPQGTAVISPISGVVSSEDNGKSAWGKRIFIKDPRTGWTFAVGHMHSFSVADGTTITAGTTIGTSGGNQNDPSSGNSSGDHIEVQFIDPQGNYVDPHPLLAQIFSGTTYAELGKSGLFAAQPGVPGPPAAQYKFTPDGHRILVGSTEDGYYTMIDSLWQQVYGQHAPWWAVQSFKDSGIQNMYQLQAALNGMPSDIPGVSLGQRQVMKAAMDTAAKNHLGRPAPDSLLKQFVKDGRTSPVAIEEWFRAHPAADMPTEDYQAIFDAANKWTTRVWNTFPSPDQVHQIWTNSGGTPAATTPTPIPVAPPAPIGKQPVPL